MPPETLFPSFGSLFRTWKSGESAFRYGAEVVTGRGIPSDSSPLSPLLTAKNLLADSRIAWVSITDNPGGGAMIPPDWLSGVLPEHKERLVLHQTCKDLNRIGLESASWRYAAEGCNNILALTGDLPISGFQGLASSVFDFDSVALIHLLKSMNDGLEINGRKGPEKLGATDFCIGAAVSPFKRHERELVPQYYKLLRKIRAGASWVLSQLGYDMRKFNEIKLLLASKKIDLPVFGNAYVLNASVARMFNKGLLPGCVVSDPLLELAEKQAACPDKGRAFFKEFAAKQIAVFKGLGFAAGYLGGISKPETFIEIIELAESFGTDDWKDFMKEIRFSQPDEFFYFEHDPATGLGNPGSVNPVFKKTCENPERNRDVNLHYRMSRLAHAIAFAKGKGLFGALKRFFRLIEANPDGKVPKIRDQRLLYKLVHRIERVSKDILYDCRDCGDCGLPDCAYLCPMSSCSKNIRNGPCGGTKDGRCEADDKDCIWARAYNRFKYFKEMDQLTDPEPIIYDAAFAGTSAWSNLYLDR